MPSPGACHVATLPLHHSSVTFLLSSLGSSSLLRRESNWENPQSRKLLFSRPSLLRGCAPGASAVSARPGLPTSRSFCRIWYSRALLCPPRTSFWMPTDALQTFPEESEAANLFPFCFSAPLPRPLLPQPLLPADREICRAESAYTWPPILLITMRAAGN